MAAVHSSPMSDKVIANMQARTAQCHRLANQINDESAIEALFKMARDIEADLVRLKAGR